jgi:hypothetical protein
MMSLTIDQPYSRRNSQQKGMSEIELRIDKLVKEGLLKIDDFIVDKINEVRLFLISNSVNLTRSYLVCLNTIGRHWTNKTWLIILNYWDEVFKNVHNVILLEELIFETIEIIAAEANWTSKKVSLFAIIRNKNSLSLLKKNILCCWEPLLFISDVHLRTKKWKKLS